MTGSITERLAEDLDNGRSRKQMMDAYRLRHEQVLDSPRFFLADGTDFHNPGTTTMQQVGSPWGGFLVIDESDETVYERVLARAIA